MLDYIKNQVKSRMSVVPEAKQIPSPEDIPNDVITEYAHIFQELDDLTVDGSDAEKVRKMAIDIPFDDDDVEIESIEFNLGDGRVTDVPADATVQEEYISMKTYEKFYQETAESMSRLPRESDSMFDKRVSEVASQKYEEYCKTAAEEGRFGFDDVNIADKRVPAKLNIDFGPIDEISNKSFITKVNTYFATDKDHNITRKQLDSVNLVRNGAFSKIGNSMMTYMESKYDVPRNSSIWDIATPLNIYVPRGNGDSFCVVLEYMNELTNEKEYFGWTRSVNPSEENNTNDSVIIEESVDINRAEEINMESFINERHYENHDMFIRREKEIADKIKERKRQSISRFYQEAIDFGDGDGGSDLPPADGDTANNEDTSMDTPDDSSTTENTSDADTSVDSDNSSDAPESNDDSDDKEEANVNDVSKEIAKKVSQQTQDDAQDSTSSDDDTSVTFDDDMGDTTTSSEDDGNASVDDQLDDLDNSMGDTDEDISDDDADIDNVSTEDDDINNLTIDQLMERGSDKLKGMTLNEIKNFLTSGSEEAVQEAFILTKKNINKELDVELRKCLGILNDGQMDLDKLLKKFKFNARGLNRVLTKAAKIREVYSTDEIQSIQKLNTSLVTLMTSLKKSKDSNYVSIIKRNIRDFVANSKVVGSFVEDKLKGKTDKSVQEGFVQEGLFLSDKNVKKRLAKCICPVHADLSSIVKAKESGKLTKGKLVRMYKPKTGTRQTSVDITEDITTKSTNSYEISTHQSDNLTALTRITSKILRKPKVQKAFSTEQLQQIDDLCDKLDDFIDFVESVLFDSSEKDSLLEQIGNDAKDILSLLDSIYAFCTSSNSISNHYEKPVDDDISGDKQEDDVLDIDIDTEDIDEDDDISSDESDNDDDDKEYDDEIKDDEDDKDKDDDKEDDDDDKEEEKEEDDE